MCDVDIYRSMPAGKWNEQQCYNPMNCLPLNYAKITGTFTYNMCIICKQIL